MEQEIWKPIKNYEELYEVSSFGRIKSLAKKWSNGSKDETLMKLSPTCKGGYVSVGLRKNGVKKTHSVHVLVGRHYVDNPYNLPEINHKDFDRTNNKADNLEWSTHGDNIRYSYKQGNRTGARGESSPVAKHTAANVLEIRRLYEEGGYSFKKLADLYNSKPTTISAIIGRKSWAHI